MTHPCRSAVTSLLVLLPLALRAADDPLAGGFASPPASAAPRVWWHWMNGNITQTGIQLDLEWMHRVGIGGVHIFDASLDTPQVVDHRLVYMTPEWKDAFRFATTLADRLGMEEAIASSPGWSETGGPWVPPEQGMKKYVWSETPVHGGEPFKGKLAHPPTSTGPYQNGGEPEGKGPHFYADTAVVAYRLPFAAAAAESLRPVLTTSGTAVDAAALAGDNPLAVTRLPVPAAGTDAWIGFAFPAPATIRAATLSTEDLDIVRSVTYGVSNPHRLLEASDNGTDYRVVTEFPEGGFVEHTVAFAPVTARYFRLTLKHAPAPETPSWMAGMDPKALGTRSPPPAEYVVKKFVLHPGARVNRFEEKAAFAMLPDLYGQATLAQDPGAVVAADTVVDLTSRLQPDGGLDWTPPPGEWRVLRFGFSLLGITNHPATAEATGLEVDKLNHGYVRHYMDGYLDSYADTVGKGMMGKRGIQYVVTDSWEAGSQNWTDDMAAQFRQRRGYDLTPWLPVLAGRVVRSAEDSDRFLWDFRKTIADLIADEHYGQVQASLVARGMRHYGESHEGGRAYVVDGMEVKKLDDIPMSAMWTQLFGENRESFNYNADDRESASVAHLYGQNLAAAESMTASAAPWAWSPATLKPTADSEFLNGINRIVIHESAHQPLVGKAPGLTLGPFGQWFNRNDTWAEQAGPWIQYLARTSFMLQQGRFEADLVYFYGEDSNLTALFGGVAPNVPAGYGFDYINADALIHELTLDGDRLGTKSGMRYRLLGLDPYSRHMSLPVLRAIHRLVEAGALVAGPKPTNDPSLADDPSEFARLATELFGDGTGDHAFGRGRVFAGQTPAQAFTALGESPDFDHAATPGGTPIPFVHRKLPDGEVYFLVNRSEHSVAVDASFRVSGKLPELWHAETGEAAPTSYAIAGGRTTIPLQLEGWGSVFVVFRRPAAQDAVTLPPTRPHELAKLDGPWTVTFPEGKGAPATATLSRLGSWSEDPDPGIRYFSGTGTYTLTVQADPAWLADGRHCWLDLGDVKNLAEVLVNGKSLGIFWHAPYRADLSRALRPGPNTLQVKVTNAWVNRMIGDEQPGAATRYTFADIRPYRADSPLLASGLIGPVRILSLDPN